MKTVLSSLFFNHWQRKSISLVLAVIIWMVVNHSLTSTKTIANVPVRVINVPPGKTIEGMHPSGRLNKKLTLSLVGNKTVLEELNSNDLEVIVDATGKSDEWIASISKRNLISLNPEIDISKGINRVYHPNFIVRVTKLVTEKIPIIITQPIGEAPRGYEFLDVWPYKLMLTVRGPEEVIRRLSQKEQKLTFNLSDISKSQLDAISAGQSADQNDVVSYLVPDQWKQINMPILSDAPIEIDDPQAKNLRIDFIRCSVIPLTSPVAASIYFPPSLSKTINPSLIQFKTNEMITNTSGIYEMNIPLFAKGVDRLFVQTVADMIEICFIASPPLDGSYFDWSVQFINPRALEDRYVSKLLGETKEEELAMMKPSLREEYLRNRFRSYMNRFKLYRSSQDSLEMVAKSESGALSVSLIGNQNTQETTSSKHILPLKK